MSGILSTAIFSMIAPVSGYAASRPKEIARPRCEKEETQSPAEDRP
jgi:hypothetical protein